MNAGQIVGYIRVSSVDQNTARQLDGVHVDRIFEDKASGKDVNRPALKEMISFVRAGDTVKVHSIDRLARNLVDLRNLVTQLNDKGVAVLFVNEGLTFTANQANPCSDLMLNMMGAFAEFERAMIRERQREGIAIAKAAGKSTGRPTSLTPQQAAEIKTRAVAGESKTALATEFGVSRATLYGVLK